MFLQKDVFKTYRMEDRVLSGPVALKVDVSVRLDVLGCACVSVVGGQSMSDVPFGLGFECSSMRLMVP